MRTCRSVNVVAAGGIGCAHSTPLHARSGDFPAVSLAPQIDERSTCCPLSDPVLIVRLAREHFMRDTALIPMLCPSVNRFHSASVPKPRSHNRSRPGAVLVATSGRHHV
jgi:hypothetical protein